MLLAVMGTIACTSGVFSISHASTSVAAKESLVEIANLLERSLALYKADQFEQALMLFRQVAAADASCATAHLYIGHTLKKLGKADEAITWFEKAIELDPHLVDGYIEAAHFYTENFRYEDTDKCLTKGLSYNPNNTHLLFQLATLYNTLNRDEESCDLFMEVRKRLPHNPSVLYNLAFTLKKLGRVQEAIPLYTHALEMNPKNAEITFSRGLAYLTAGLFEQGWADYEARWSRGQLGPERVFEQPMWDGSSLDGKSIFLHAEQGLGDTFQFVRYAKVAKDRGARSVVVAVQTPLVTVLKLCPYIDEVIALKDKPWPVTDYHAPLASMPYVCKTRIDNVPAEIPYLYADEQLVAYWKDKLSSDKNFKIGIVWNGNSNYSTAQLRAIVAQKSVQLAQFKVIADCPGVSLYCLQKETGMDQLHDKSYGFELKLFPEDFDESHGRFMDTAAVIKNLDLVVAVDTGSAHIAAALGAPVWVLLPHPSDWRWMNDRLDTPWYPNMRLFRQPRAGDWEPVFAEIATEIKKLISGQIQNPALIDAKDEKTNTPITIVEKKSEQKSELLVEKKSINSSVELNKELVKEKHALEEQLDMLRSRIISLQQDVSDELFGALVQRWVLFSHLRDEVTKKIKALDSSFEEL